MPKVYPGSEECAKRLSDACMSTILKLKVADDIKPHEALPHNSNYRLYRSAAKIQIANSLYCSLLVEYSSQPLEQINYSFESAPVLGMSGHRFATTPHKIDCVIGIIYKSRTVTGVKHIQVKLMKFLVPVQFNNPGAFIERIVKDYLDEIIPKSEETIQEYRMAAREKKKWERWSEKMKQLAPAAAEGETLHEFEMRTKG